LIKYLKDLDTARKDPTDPAAAEAKFTGELKTKVDTALAKVKDAARDPNVDRKTKVALEKGAEEVQKAYVAIRTELKKENDSKAALVTAAKVA